MKRLAIAAVGFALVVVAAALVAVFGLPYGRSHPQAFAHVYTLPANGNTTHLHIDADITNGTRPCDPIDDSATVGVGWTHKVGVCLEDYVPNSVNQFELHIRYSGDPNATPPTTLNTAATEPYGGSPKSCPGGDTRCVDANPDANDGNDPTGFKLGGGWDCSAFGLAPPLGEDPGTPGVADARIVCFANLSTPDQVEQRRYLFINGNVQCLFDFRNCISLDAFQLFPEIGRASCRERV